MTCIETKPYDRPTVFGARVISVIETMLELRGDGKTDPYRRIIQYWSLDGQLLAEVDPNEQMTGQS